MKISKGGLDIIKAHEGWRSCPYLCPAGIPTIGYGNTYYPNGDSVTMDDECIDEETGEVMLLDVIKRYEDGVNRYVKTEINQNQFDALVSFAYNLGLGALQKSTLLSKVNNDPCDPNIAYQFSRWVRANGRVLEGLVRRRHDESKLYFS